MDVFQSVRYRLVLLFFAVELTVVWFVLGPSNPWYAVGVVGATFALGPAVAAPLCDVCLANGSASLRASAYSTAS
jgi:hypothetical protein